MISTASRIVVVGALIHPLDLVDGHRVRSPVVVGTQQSSGAGGRGRQKSTFPAPSAASSFRSSCRLLPDAAHVLLSHRIATSGLWLARGRRDRRRLSASVSKRRMLSQGRRMALSNRSRSRCPSNSSFPRTSNTWPPGVAGQGVQVEHHDRESSLTTRRSPRCRRPVSSSRRRRFSEACPEAVASMNSSMWTSFAVLTDSGGQRGGVHIRAAIILWG